MVDFQAVQAKATAPAMTASSLIGRFWDFREKIAGMAAEASAVEVRDEVSMRRASEMIAQAKKLKNAMGKKRAEVTRPLLDMKKAVDGSVAVLATSVDDVIKALDSKTIPYLRKMEEERKRKAAAAAEAMRKASEEAERKEEEERIRAAADAKAEAAEMGYTERDASELVADAVAAVVPVAPEIPAESVEDRTKIKTDSGSTTLDYEYVGELVDIRDLPVNGIKARWDQIKAAVQPWINGQIKFGSRSIPGVRITRREVIKRRVR